LQLDTILGCVGRGVETPLPALVVVLEMVVLVLVELEVVTAGAEVAEGTVALVVEDEVVTGSLLTVPITQYDFLVSKLGR